MRLVALPLALVAGLLVGLAPAHAVARPPAAPGDHGPGPDERHAAERALAAVAQAFEPGRKPSSQGNRDLTMHLVELAQGLDQLAPEDRRIARSYLARPTDAGFDMYGDGYQRDAQITSQCWTTACVTWDNNAENPDAPPGAGGSAVPAQVTATADVLAEVWDRIVTMGGYRAPLPDAGEAGKAGPNALFDVYLADVGEDGFYGYCAPDTTARKSSAYCVLDDDYASAQCPRQTPTENLQVTGAHEFFHAVQFAYDVYDDPWFMEGTAAWVEDEIYDDVDDNRGYLRYSPLRRPWSSLTRSRDLWVYGSWIWWRFLTDHPDLSGDAGTGLPVLVRQIWERAAARDVQSIQALRAELRAQSSASLRIEPLLAAFGVANRRPAAAHYEEGADYPSAPLRRSHELDRDERRLAWQSFPLNQLANSTVRLRPADDLGSGPWKLRLTVDLPSTSKRPVATAVVYRDDGTSSVRSIELADDGSGAVRVPFNSTVVDRVELTMTNAGMTNRLDFRYTARAVK